MHMGICGKGIRVMLVSCLIQVIASSVHAAPEDCKNPRVSYFECATLIQQALKVAPDPLADPTQVFQLAALWDAKFEAEYEDFRRSKRLKSAKSDYELIMEEIEKKI